MNIVTGSSGRGAWGAYRSHFGDDWTCGGPQTGFMISAVRHTASSTASELGRFIEALLQKGLEHLCANSGAPMDPVLRQPCREAIESLWPRRRALARLLGRAPRMQRIDRLTPGASPRLSPLDHATVDLHIAASTAARALLGQMGAEWRDLERGSRAQARLPWPPTPGLCAQAVRCAIEHATGDDDVRLALMQLSIAIVMPEYVALCDRLLASRGREGQLLVSSSPLAGRAPLPSRPAVDAASPRGAFEKLRAA